MRLIPVLIPRPLWGINAHRLLAGEQWQRMRRDTFSRDNHQCVICQQQRQLECHEVFSYDDNTGKAVLERLESRCPNCHDCNHLGRLRKKDPEGFKRALVRISDINNMKPKEVILLVKEAFLLHSTRTRPWEVRVAPDLLNAYPELAKLEGHYSAAHSE
jgi:hypothetical protein